MKIFLLLLFGSMLIAESKTEKELRAKATVLERDNAAALAQLSICTTRLALLNGAKSSQSLDVLRRGASAATEAAQNSESARVLGEMNHQALLDAMDAVGRHTEMIKELHQSQILNGRLQVILAACLVVVVVIHIFRGRQR
jgi:hypothetical protein